MISIILFFHLFWVSRTFVWSGKSTFEWNNEVNAEWSVSNGTPFYFRLFRFSAHLFEKDPFIVIFDFTSLPRRHRKISEYAPKKGRRDVTSFPSRGFVRILDDRCGGNDSDRSLGTLVLQGDGYVPAIKKLFLKRVEVGKASAAPF